MMEHYANHMEEADFLKSAEITSDVFGRILAFEKKEA
jgi:hypothetical protein